MPWSGGVIHVDLVVGWVSALLGCATCVPPDDIARIKTVGIVSFAGGKLVMANAGILTPTRTHEVGEWGVDAIIVDEAAKALMARVNVVPVTYDTPGLWRDFGSTRLSDVVRKNVTPAAVDAYVVVWPIFEAGVLIGDPLGGITLFNNDGLIGTTTTLSTSFEMTVLDGQTFQQLASRQVSYPFGPNDLELMISIDVDRSLWADTYEMLTADQKIKIQAILKVMLQNEIPATLMGMGMAR